MEASSRLRCEVRWVDKNRGPSVEVFYPPEYNDEYVLKSVRQFCFPCGNDKLAIDDSEAVQLFTFVLTDASSQYTFGYCRLTPSTNSCLCALSGLAWASLFYKFLNHLSTVCKSGTSLDIEETRLKKADVESLLTNAYHIDIPAGGTKLHLNECSPIGRFADKVPDNGKLPSLRDDKFMLEFYNAVSEKQMIPIYASLLKERRIIFTSRKLSQLSSCVFAASRLLYPFHWWAIMSMSAALDKGGFQAKPIYPRATTRSHRFLNVSRAPMPYLIGVPKQTFINLMSKHDHHGVGEIVVVDLDRKTFESHFTDTLPSDAHNFLRNRLKSSPEMFNSDGLARAFLRTNAFLYGKYALGYVKNESSGLYEWDRRLFVERQRPSIQAFLTTVIGHDGAQYFERFIEERLRALNAGEPTIDEFDREVAAMDSKYFTDSRLIPTLQNKPPEVIQNAVSSMRENAGDVIAGLKGRVQAISIKDTIGKLAPKPKEVRRRRLRPAKGRMKAQTSIDPISIDVSVYDFNNPLGSRTGTSSYHARSTAPINGDDSQSVSDAESVKSTGDLIDLSTTDFTPAAQLHTISSTPGLLEYTPSQASQPTSSTIQPSLPTLSPSNPFLTSHNWISLGSQPLPAPHYHPDSAMNGDKPTSKRDKWEKFE